METRPMWIDHFGTLHKGFTFHGPHKPTFDRGWGGIDLVAPDRDHAPDGKFCILTGNPVDGFSAIGPFEFHEDAVRNYDETGDGGDWWIIKLSDGLDISE